MPDNDLNMDFLENASEGYFDALKVWKEARFRLGLRGSLTLVALAVGTYFISISMGDVGYYFKKDTPVLVLGNLRAKDFDRERVMALYTNDCVSFENDAIMFDDLQSEQFSFYYSPITKFVVRTSRELPDKEVYRIADRIVELDMTEAGLVSSRMAFPSDLAVSFAGEGRVLSGADIPDWAHPIIAYMSNSSGVPPQEMRLFLDGDKPQGYRVFLLLIIGATVLMAATVAFFLDAVVRYRRAKKTMLGSH
jgi:hypothetical protein